MKIILSLYRSLTNILFLLYSFQLAIAHDKDLQEAITLNSLPPVEMVIQSAIDSQPKSFQEEKDWIERIRRSVWLPAITLSYGRGEANYSRYERIIPLGKEQDVRTIPLDTDLRWQDDYRITLVWNLSNLIFSNSELTAVENQRLLKEFELKVINQVTGYYFELKDALIRLQDDNEKEKISWQMRKQRNMALLNAFTNGFISEYVSQQLKKEKTPALQQPYINFPEQSQRKDEKEFKYQPPPKKRTKRIR